MVPFSTGAAPDRVLWRLGWLEVERLLLQWENQLTTKDPVSYSARSATTGSKRVARRAGK